jgi:hypothetical protein
MEHPQKFRLSTPIGMPSQEIFNTNIVANFRSSRTAIYMPYSDKHNESYSIGRLQTNADSAECRKQIQFGAKIRISPRTELNEPFDQN